MTEELLSTLESEIFQKSPIAVAILDVDEKILDVNEAFENMFQYKRTEITQKKINDFIVPKDLVDEALQYAKVLKRGKYLIEATKRKRKDGELLDVSITAYTIKDKDNRHLIIANYFEIKDKINLKVNLARKEKEFEAVFQSSPVGIIVCEGDTNNVLDINSTALDILSLKKDKIVGKSCSNLIISSKLLSEQDNIKKEEHTLRLNNGTEKIVYNTSKIIEIEKKKYVVNNIIDVTEFKTNEMKLNMMQHAISQSLDGIIIADTDGKIVYYNQRWIDLHGLKPTEINGINLKIFQKDSTQYNLKKNYDRPIKGKKDKSFNYSFRKRADGSLFPSSISSSDILNKEQKKIGEIEIVHDITELIEIEKELLVREKQFQTIVDSKVIGVGILNNKGEYNLVNQALADMLGYRKEEMIGKNISTFIYQGEETRFQEFRAMHALGKHVISEGAMKKKNGDLLNVYVSDSPLFDEAGKIEGRIGVVIDITALKTAEKQLQYERDRAQNYLEIAGVIILALDMKANITLINSKGCEILGYKEEELIGKNAFEYIVFKDHRKGIEKLFSEVISNPKMSENIYVVEVVTKNGDFRTVSWRHHLLRDDNGNISGLLSSGEDITDQKAAEQALRDSEEKFRTISAYAKDAIIIMNDEGQVTYWNISAARIFGFSKAEIIGKNLHAILAPDRDSELIIKEILEFQTTGKSSVMGRTLDLTVKRKDGIFIPIELSLSAVKLKDRWNAIGIAREVSERRKAEQQIREARDRALDASRFKSQFLANMSHEIRTPMNAIIGMTDLALLTKLDTEQKEYLEMVKSSANSLLVLLNDILDLSKIEAGKLEIEFEPFDIREMIATTLGSLAIKAHEKNIELAYNISQNVPEKLIGDSVRIRQVIINLVGNAIKFTEVGEVLLNIIPINKSEKEVTILFSVSDTGIGISEEKRDRIFDMFSQADGSTTRKYGGTGLGLAISSQLVKLMGGEIWVDSAAGKGSTFYFNIRFKLPKETVIPQPEPDIEKLKGKKVLIVDDNETNRLILKEMVENWNMKAIEAESGFQTMEILNNIKSENDWPAYILIDSNMPGMDGFTVVEKIRQMEGSNIVHIMMISSGSHADGIKRCEELGIYGHLLKPINPAKLKTLMVEILEDKKGIEKKISVKSSVPVSVSINVLLAEDNLVNQKLAVKMLEKMGHTISLAENGEQVLNLLEKDKFDLILMDIQMPVMDGLIATTKIREMEKISKTHIPIVAMTAHALKGDRERCIAAGMDGYISKPISYKDLEKELMRVVDKLGGDQIAEVADTSEAPKLFKDILMRKFSNDREMLHDTITIFLEESPDQLIAIKNAIINKDKDKLQFNAHKLKGSIGVFDEGDLFYDATMLEAIGKSGRIEEAEDMILSFEDRFINLREELKKIAAELK